MGLLINLLIWTKLLYNNNSVLSYKMPKRAYFYVHTSHCFLENGTIPQANWAACAATCYFHICNLSFQLQTEILVKS